MMNKKIKIGIFGFGKTGRLVTNEFLQDRNFDVVWVARRTLKDHYKFASHLLGYEYERGAIYS